MGTAWTSLLVPLREAQRAAFEKQSPSGSQDHPPGILLERVLSLLPLGAELGDRIRGGAMLFWGVYGTLEWKSRGRLQVLHTRCRACSAHRVGIQ